MSTIRQQIIEILQQDELNAIDISQMVSIPEREVYEHLEHINRSLKAKNRKLLVTPYCCLSCGHLFKDRHRFTRPGRCPKCKGSHIRMAVYRIAEGH